MFQQVQSLVAEANGSELLTTDLNRDGKMDLIARVRGDSIIVYYGISDGKFSEPRYYMIGGVPITLTLGDFIRDGRNLRTNLFVPLPSFSSAPTLNMAILTLDGLRGFDAPRAFDFALSHPFPGTQIASDMKSGDLNGDGVLDLVIVSREFLGGDGSPNIIFGNGRGEFSAPVPINSGGTNSDTIAIDLRDFNNDGKLDLALLNMGTQNVVVLLGNGRGEFTQSATFDTSFLAKMPASADFNNDGYLDLVVNARSGGLALYLGNGQGGFAQGATGIGGNLFSLVFTTGDLNGDGNADLAFFDDQQAPSSDGFKLKVLFGNGQGGFGAPIDLTTEEHVSFMTTADLNLDGRDDLVYNHLFGNSTFFVALSNPGGSFAAPVRYQGSSTIRSILVKDINGDSKPDLIITENNNIGRVSIRSGNGDGSFNQPVNLLDFDNPRLTITGDFDEDGNIDFAIARQFNSQVGIFLNKSACIPTASVIPVSAASNFRYRVAGNSLVTLQGANLATNTRAAIPPFLPPRWPTCVSKSQTVPASNASLNSLSSHLTESHFSFLPQPHPESR